MNCSVDKALCVVGLALKDSRKFNIEVGDLESREQSDSGGSLP